MTKFELTIFIFIFGNRFSFSCFDLLILSDRKVFDMNRFEYAQAVLRDDESFVAKHTNMKLYHGHQKVLRNITQ